MPEKHIRFDFNKTPSEANFETVRCVRCGYEIPVLLTFVDYGVLYEELKEKVQKILSGYDDLFLEMQEEIPEAKIFLHNRKAELIEMVKEALARIRSKESAHGEAGHDA